MRRAMSAVVLSLAVLLPVVGNAQVTGEPVLVNGLYFYPTREFRIFDANVMTQVASAQPGPVYVDSTLAANTVVYLPAGSGRMQAYRIGAPPTVSAPQAVPPLPVNPPGEQAVGTSGSTVPAVVGTGSNVNVTQQPATSRTVSSRRQVRRGQATQTPQGNLGIWIEYAGTRYYADGPAAVYTADRFEKIGEHSGFPVYREAGDSNSDRIWLAAAIDGPVAPFVKK